MKIIIINGYPLQLAGKDTFVQICQKVNGYNIKNLSTIDFVKKIAKECGWNEEKTPENRKFLSDLKDLLSSSPWGDIPFQKIKEEINNFNKENSSLKKICFIHAREPENIDKLVKELKAKTLLIQRSNSSQNYFNHADKEVLNYNYDFIINNDKGILELSVKAVNFLKTIDEE